MQLQFSSRKPNDMSLKFFFYVYFSVFQIQAFTTSQLEVVKSVSDDLSRRQIIIVKNVQEETINYNLVAMVKYFSNFKIYTTFHSVNEMKSTLYQFDSPGSSTYKYSPRTIAIMDDNDLPEMTQLYFNYDYDVATPMIVWLAFDNSTDNFMNKNAETYIPYNCQFLLIKPTNNSTYEMIEIYKKNPTPTTHFLFTHVGIWNISRGLDVSVNDFYSRRFDLNGTTFGIYTGCDASEEAHVCAEEFICPYKDSTVLANIITAMGYMMNFRCAYVYTYDNNSYSEFQIDFPNSRTEFFIDEVYMFDSINYVNHLIHLRTARAFLHLGYHKIYEKGMSSPFIQPFTHSLWLSIGAWVLASTVIVVLINYIIYINQKPFEFFEIIDACFASFESFTSQWGSGNTTEKQSSRMATFMIQIPPLFLVLAYSGIIISFITVRIIVLPFQDLEGLVKDGTYKIGFIRENKVIASWFTETDNPTAKSAYIKFVIDEGDLPQNEIDETNRMCDDPKFSVIDWDDFLFQYKWKCDPLQIPSPVYKSNVGLLLREYSPYKNIFDQMFYRLRAVGILSRMTTNVLFTDVDGLKAINGENYPTKKSFDVDFVDWDAVQSVFILLGMAYLTSIAILLLECYIFRFLTKRF